MNNDKELLEALLAGKVLVSNKLQRTIQLVDGNIKLLDCFNTNCIGKDYKDTSDSRLDLIKGTWQIKPEVILINGIEVPAPERTKPKEGTTYYVPALRQVGFIGLRWDTAIGDHLHLVNGLVHLVQENAITHAKALLSFTTQENQ